MIDLGNNGTIETINEYMSEGHRVKPYDLTSAKDLNEALLVTVATYRDYWHYENTLVRLEDNFDESLEYSDTAAWFNLSLAPEDVDDLTQEGLAVLNAATVVFDRLTERAKKNCARIVKTILDAPPTTQKLVFGCVYKIEPGDMDARIGELFDMLGEVEYHHAMPKNRDAFLELMSEQWAALK